MKLQDLTGHRFGRLTVLCRMPSQKERTMWQCKCDCGNIVQSEAYNIKTGNTSSCGCLKMECQTLRLTTHGKRNSPEYLSWAAMIARTSNPNNIGYKGYGGRGIRVCERWRGSFENFMKDMGCKPSSKHSLDRIDNDKDYSPENCRWATRTLQARNRRSNYLITHDGVTKSLAEWAEIKGMNYSLLYSRIVKFNWDTTKAFKTPSRRLVR